MVKYKKIYDDIVIRSAQIEDIPELIKMADSFFEYGNLNRFGITIDEDSIRNCIEIMINGNESFVILSAEYHGKIIGTISGVISPWITNVNNKILIEQWWWIKEQYRIKKIDKYLLESFENIGKNNNCIAVIMVSIDNTRKGFERYYKMKGYELLEHSYIKEV